MSKDFHVDLVCDPGCILGEGPIWNANEHKLYFTDIENCKLWRCDPASREFEIFWEGNHHIGGFAFNHSGDLILCAGNKVLKLYRNGTLKTLFELNFSGEERFNDITTDPLGRIYAGTAGGEAGSNRLFRFEKEHQAELILTGISCSNGMTFSLDGKSFFHTNTAALRITEYDYDRDSGNISNGQVFFQGNENMGLPDGLTLDSEGCIWVAFWDGSAIRRFSPDGEILETIKLPAKRPTSIIFGGQELNELYITTASVGRISANNRVNKDGEFLGGGIYSFKPRVHGRSEWLADF